MGAVAEQLRRRQFSGLVATPVRLQTALHTVVHLVLNADSGTNALRTRAQTGP